MTPMDRGPHPRWGESEPRLVEVIRDEILAAPEERITFARFMECALTEPALGYYATSELRPSREGDFLTAPELHPFFGRCIGRFIAAAHKARGSADTFRVHEYGAGRGRLRDSAGDEIAIDVEWTRVDLQVRTEQASGPADLVIANEFLDALPVHRLVHDGELREAWVGWADDWFREVIAEPSSPELARHLAAEGVSLRDGQRAEVCLAAPRWLAGVAGSLAPGGVVLVIDYGHQATELYGPRRMAGSLLTYHGHEVADDPFAAVGRSDITAHVDITALERAADEAGLVLAGATTQAQFLARLGLGELLAGLGRTSGIDPQAYLDARAAVARLLDPRHLGAFRVLAWADTGDAGVVPSLPGFAESS